MSVKKNVIAIVLLLASSMAIHAGAQSNQVVIGYSGTGLTTDLRKLIDRENIWEKYNLSVKSVYFNSGSLMAQAMLGNSITASDSDVPAVMGLVVAGVIDAKLVAVSINRLEHFFVVRKNIMRAEDLKGSASRSADWARPRTWSPVWCCASGRSIRRKR